jgi:hypothetical protein
MNFKQRINSVIEMVQGGADLFEVVKTLQEIENDLGRITYKAKVSGQALIDLIEMVEGVNENDVSEQAEFA